jgi:hypothetical protein
MSHARQSRLGFPSTAGLLLYVLLVAFPATAQQPIVDALPTLDTLRNRLELTAQQEAQLQPIFQKRTSELQETQLLLQRAASRQQKRDVLRNAKKAGDAFNSQVESVLTPSQKNEWREIRSAVREKAQERAAEKRSSQ